MIFFSSKMLCSSNNPLAGLLSSQILFADKKSQFLLSGGSPIVRKPFLSLFLSCFFSFLDLLFKYALRNEKTTSKENPSKIIFLTLSDATLPSTDFLFQICKIFDVPDSILDKFFNPASLAANLYQKSLLIQQRPREDRRE